MYSSSEDSSDSDSGTNFKRGKRKEKVESPVKNDRKSPNRKATVDRDTRRPESNFEQRRIESNHEQRRPESNHEQRRPESNYERRQRSKKQAQKIRDRRRSGEYIKRSNSRSRERKPRSRSRSDVTRKPIEIEKRSEVTRKDNDRRSEKESESSKLKSRHSTNERKSSDKIDLKKTKHENPSTDRKSSKSRRSESPAKRRSNEKSSAAKKVADSYKNGSEGKSHNSSKASSESKTLQPSLDDASAYGPALPPAAAKPEVHLPALPKHHKHRSPSPRVQRPVIGPALPKDVELNSSWNNQYDDVISSGEDDNMIGPLPASVEMSERELELEKRKIEFRLKLLDKRMEAVTGSDVKHREEWMLSLPEVKKVADMGLSARQFRKNDRPDFSDRSDWTKTPNDDPRKKAESHEVKVKEAEEKKRDLERSRRDEEQERMAKAHKKTHKRDKTLLEIHEKKLKKEKKKQKERDAEKKAERRPFSRDTDLSANKFDEARKKSAIKKAQLLDTRFSKGSNKYL